MKMAPPTHCWLLLTYILARTPLASMCWTSSSLSFFNLIRWPTSVVGSTKPTILGASVALGKRFGQFANPTKIMIDGNGNIYVSDCANDRIILIQKGNYTNNNWIYCNGFNGDNFNNPIGLALDSNGVLFVADTGNRRIVRLGAFPPANAADWQVYEGGAANKLNYPTGVAVAGQNLFVTDFTKYTTISGNQLPNLAGANPGRIIEAQVEDVTGSNWQINTTCDAPYAIWAGNQGLYVSDQITNLIYIFKDIGDANPTRRSGQKTLFCSGKSWNAQLVQAAGICVGPP